MRVNSNIVNHLASKSRKKKMKISKRTNTVELLMSV
ncbi:TonB-dependent receptor [Leptospira santarosai]|uniref:TonB-dependent receptor n=1 Tax=Leptospira santarosai TaxID=28183 RepID=A0A2P1QSQ5_9LEPT|nr:TonB-dependent receptor [Leptospira santarosai]